jgi:hypothetical protein
VSIPVNAMVRAVPNFLVCLLAARSFMDERAPVRLKKLQPKSSKRGRCFHSRPQAGELLDSLMPSPAGGNFKLNRQGKLPRRLPCPSCGNWCWLDTSCYTHILSEVLLLSTRHERELGYGLARLRCRSTLNQAAFDRRFV